MPAAGVFSHSCLALSVSPIPTGAGTSQNEQIVKVPSAPVSHSVGQVAATTTTAAVAGVSSTTAAGALP
jgi:hypothetical protein